MPSTRSHVRIAKEVGRSYPDTLAIGKVRLYGRQVRATRLSAHRGNDDVHTRDTRRLAE